MGFFSIPLRSDIFHMLLIQLCDWVVKFIIFFGLWFLVINARLGLGKWLVHVGVDIFRWFFFELRIDELEMIKTKAVIQWRINERKKGKERFRICLGVYFMPFALGFVLNLKHKVKNVPIVYPYSHYKAKSCRRCSYTPGYCRLSRMKCLRFLSVRNRLETIPIFSLFW